MAPDFRMARGNSSGVSRPSPRMRQHVAGFRDRPELISVNPGGGGRQ